MDAAEREAAIAELNKVEINIGDLRKFLAAMTQLDIQTIPLGVLLVAIRSFIVKETNATEGPSRPPVDVGTGT